MSAAGLADAGAIVRAHGASLTRDTDSPAMVTVERLSRDAARALVSELRAAGHTADDAPDAEDGGMAWVYVTPAS